MRNQERGSVLIFVLVLALIGSFVLLAVQGMAYRGSLRGARAAAEKQAFFTARSAAEAVAGEIAGTDGTQPPPFSNGPGHNEITVTGLEPEMGGCEVDLFLAEEERELPKASVVLREVTITATAEKNEATHTSVIVLRNYKGDADGVTGPGDLVDYVIVSYQD